MGGYKLARPDKLNFGLIQLSTIPGTKSLSLLPGMFEQFTL